MYNVFTMRYWRSPKNMEDIQTPLNRVPEKVKQYFRSVAKNGDVLVLQLLRGMHSRKDVIIAKKNITIDVIDVYRCEEGKTVFLLIKPVKDIAELELIGKLQKETGYIQRKHYFYRLGGEWNYEGDIIIQQQPDPVLDTLKEIAKEYEVGKEELDTSKTKSLEDWDEE